MTEPRGSRPQGPLGRRVSSKPGFSPPPDVAHDELSDEKEPLSLAEELAEEAEQGFDETDQRNEQIKQDEIHIAELQRMSMGQ